MFPAHFITAIFRNFSNFRSMFKGHFRNALHHALLLDSFMRAFPTINRLQIRTTAGNHQIPVDSWMIYHFQAIENLSKQ